MERRRLGVMLPIRGRTGAEVDGLRRALGDTQLDRIAPHVTVVPPINIREEDLAEVLDVVRSAAARRSGPLSATIGPVSSFLPDNATLWLAVSPPEEVSEVHDHCLRGPLERPEHRRYVPHVTIALRLPEEEHPAALRLLSGYEIDVEIDRVELMQLVRFDDSERWVPIADAVFGGTSRVDAGPLRLELTESSLIDPVVAGELGVEPEESLGRGAGDGLVVVARDVETTEAVGLAAGRRRGRRAGVLREVFVGASSRELGVGRRLIAAWENAARSGGAHRAVAPTVNAEVADLLEHLGWDRSEPILDRRL